MWSFTRIAGPIVAIWAHIFVLCSWGLVFVAASDSIASSSEGSGITEELVTDVSPSAAAIVDGGSAQSPPIGGRCRLIWPKMGDFYSRKQRIYVQYYCDLTNLPPSVTNTSGLSAYVHFGASCFDGAKREFVGDASGRVDYPYSVTIPILSQGFSLSVIGEGACHSVKYEFRIFVDNTLIDIMDSVLFIMPDSYFEREYPLRDGLSATCAFDTSTQSCGEGSQVPEPCYYDFMEIGTSGFNTLIEAASDWHVGLSVEVMKDLQDTLPDRAGVIKVNAAIGDVAGWSDIYYFPKHFLEYWGYSLNGTQRDLFGLASLGAPNPLHPIRNVAQQHFVPDDLTTHRRMVRVRPVGQLMAEYGVANLAYLKVDTEGYDVRIIKAILAYCAVHTATVRFPRYIQFENNIDIGASAELLVQLIELGYRVYSVLYGRGYSINNETYRGQGAMYAELAEASPHYWDIQTRDVSMTQGAQGVFPRVSSFLSSHLPVIRTKCRDHLDSVSFFAEGSGHDWDAGGFFCSLLSLHGDEDENADFIYVTHEMII